LLAVAELLSGGPKAQGGEIMLTAGKMVGFVLTKDYEQARTFYEGKLGFDFVSLDQFALVIRAGENMIRIVKMPDFEPLRSTVLGWEVGDVEAAVTWLVGRGVAMEKYPWVADKERGIWTTPDGNKVAWFKDPDGNVLSVSQHR
jgi:catechol 2,3-dioxygenase-like lactoylglutathione lyase family enzyme